jgi:hypothetical protein
MFQAVFRAQSDALLAWPILGLVIFIAVFTVKVIAVMRSPSDDVKQRSELPLADEQKGGVS